MRAGAPGATRRAEGRRRARPVPGKKAFVFISLARKKEGARARPAPPKHAPRGDAEPPPRADSLSFATSRLAKVTVQRAGSSERGSKRARLRRPPPAD